MSYTYVYKFTINNLKFVTDLYDYIKNIPNIPTDFQLYIESTVDISFIEELSDGQTTILNTAIQSYVPITETSTFDHSDTINITKNTINNNNYLTFATDYWISEIKSSSDNIKLKYIMLASNIEYGSYQIRIYDIINNNILFESDILSNINNQVLKFSNIQNIPENDTLIEFQCKTINNSGLCKIKSMHYIFYKYES